MDNYHPKNDSDHFLMSFSLHYIYHRLVNLHIHHLHLDLPYKSKTLHEVVFSDSGLNVKTLDIAKRLLDYNIHPFTVYFPLIIQGAMMIEPTETESKETLDNFISVMKTILKEANENPEHLKNSPHNTPVSRLDEVYAARKLILRWEKSEEN